MKSTQLLFIPTPFLHPNSITTPTIKNCWLSLKLSGWRHYLEGSSILIGILTDHKNVEYFFTTKVLTHREAEYLAQFNLTICFHPGKLGTKPDSLTRRWDVYPKGGNSNYATVNLSNLCPMFMQEQISTSLRATQLVELVFCATVIMDQEKLNTISFPHFRMTLFTLLTRMTHSHNGPLLLMVSSDMITSFIFPIQMTYNSAFPLQTWPHTFQTSWSE